jgi:hypothetical protein
LRVRQRKEAVRHEPAIPRSAIGPWGKRTGQPQPHRHLLTHVRYGSAKELHLAIDVLGGLLGPQKQMMIFQWQVSVSQALQGERDPNVWFILAGAI